tara:strand:+ start:25874 stop:26515 length:642 start_codon:yes stop_codon:yes gene_type:complete
MLPLIEIDSPKSFIAGAKIPEEVCDGLLEFYEDCTYLEKEPGKTGGGIDKSVKDSLDLSIPVHLRDQRVVDFIEQLGEATMTYIDRYPAFGRIQWDLISEFNIQEYPPGGGFFSLHCEKMSNAQISSQRVMAWMTYLNTVETGGHTFFPMQNARIKPVKGLTLIWPADWTHMHRGEPAPVEVKTIATGWYDYTDPPLAQSDSGEVREQKTSTE